MIVSKSYTVESTAIPGDNVVLAQMKMGDLTVHASTIALTADSTAVTHSQLDASTIFGHAPKIVDFTGYYLCGPGNPAYAGQPVDEEQPAGSVHVVVWDVTQEEFLPSTSSDRRPFPWPPGIRPPVLVVHSDGTVMAFVVGDQEKYYPLAAVGAWARLSHDLGLGARPLVDPLVLLSCFGARSSQTMADEVGRLVWGPTGDVSIGASAISLADEAAGLRVGITLYRTEDGRAGRFGSSWPYGLTGELVRWAYRERFAGGDVSWIAEQLAPLGTPLPPSARPREIKNADRLFGWHYFDERDFRSRQAALTPTAISSSYVTLVPNHAYRPGTPATADLQTGKITASAEPWHIREQGTLPFSPDEVVWVAGHFVRGHFVVPDPEDNRSFLASPRDFSLRLEREYRAAERAEAAQGRVLPRTVVLLTDHERVPPEVVSLLAQTLKDVDFITVSLPGTMFLDDHLGTVIPQTRVALVPGSGDTSTPVWTKTSSLGTAPMTARPAAVTAAPALSPRVGNVPGSSRTAEALLDPPAGPRRPGALPGGVAAAGRPSTAPAQAPGPAAGGGRTADQGGRTADRKVDGLARWAGGELAGPGQVPAGPVVLFADPAMDCLARAGAAFRALHGRGGNRPADDAVAGAGLPGLLSVLGAVAGPAGDPRTLAAALRRAPAAAALIMTRPPGDDRAHVYWLVADGRSGQVVLRWVDELADFGQPARLDGPDLDWWARQLYDPHTRIAVFGPDGRPTTADALAGPGTATQADAATGQAAAEPAQAAAEPALNQPQPTVTEDDRTEPAVPVPRRRGTVYRPKMAEELDGRLDEDDRAQLLSLIRALALTGQRLLDGLGDDRASQQMAAIFAELAVKAQQADSMTQLTMLDAAAGAQVAGLEMVRMMRLQRALATAETWRPEWYGSLLGRAAGLWSRLAALPSKPWQMPQRSGSGSVPVGDDQTLPAVRRRLANAVDELWRAYYSAAILTSEPDPGTAGPSSAAIPQQSVAGRDPLAGDPSTDAAAEAQAALRDARGELDSLVTEIEDLVNAIRDTPIDRPPATLPPAGANPDGLPDPRQLLEKFDPPHHLAADEPALGSDTVLEISDAVVTSIRDQVYAALPQRMKATERRQERVRDLIDSKIYRNELLRDSQELIGNRYVVEIDGVQVDIRLRPLHGRQVSNAIAVRPKTMENVRYYLDLARNHGHFTDVNFNVAYSRDDVRGMFPAQMTGTEAYMGLATLVLSEHNETVISRVLTTNERTIKNSSYASYLFSYTAQVEVQLSGGVRRAGAEAPRFADGVRIVSGRETLPPRRDADGTEDPAAMAASEAVHESAVNPAPLLQPGQAYRLPANAGIEAINAAAEIREQILEYAERIAPEGSWNRRTLDKHLTMRALKQKLPQAATPLGARIRFGGPGTGSAHWVKWWVGLVPVRVRVLRDTGTWMDLDDREHRSYGVAVTDEAAFDIPPGVFLFAVPMNLLKLDWLEPFLFAWPSLDAEHSRSGAGMATTRLVGLRYLGEPTSVIELRATLFLSRSGRSARPYQPRQLTGSVFARPLTSHVRDKVAAVPLAPKEPGGTERPAPRVRAPENIWASSLARVTELDGADDIHGRAVLVLQRHFRGFLPGPKGSDGMIWFLPRWLNLANKFAAQNEEQLRAFAEKLKENFRTARGPRGYTARLFKADAWGRTKVALVRARIREGYFNENGEWVPAGPEPAAWYPDSELDANYTEEQDTISSRAQIGGLWAGGQVVVGIGQAKRSALEGVEVRPMLHGRWVLVRGGYAGLSSWYMHGFDIDDLHALRGPATLFLSVEDEPDRPVTRPEPSSRAWAVPSILLTLLRVALLAAVVPQLTAAEALLIIGPQVLHWLGPRGLRWSGGDGDESEPFTGVIPGPESGRPMRPVIQTVRDTEVMSAIGEPEEIDADKEELGAPQPRGAEAPPAGPSAARDGAYGEDAIAAAETGHRKEAGDLEGTGARQDDDAREPEAKAEVEIEEGEVIITMPAPEPGTGRTIHAQPIRGEYEVVIPTSMTSKLVTGPDGKEQWVPYDTGRTDEAGRNTGVGTEQLMFTATEENPFPPHLFVEAQGDGIIPAIDEAFEELGFVRLPLDARVQIESAVAAALGATTTLREAREPLEIWEGVIAHPAVPDQKLTGHSVTGSVQLRMVVERAETIALPESYATYNDTGLVALAGTFTEKTGWPLAGWNVFQWWSRFLGLRTRTPVNVGKRYPNEAPKQDDDPSVNKLFTITMQPQQFHRLEQTAGSGKEVAASVGRMNLEMSVVAVALAAVRFDIIVDTRHTRYLKGEYNERQARRWVSDTGFTVLAASDATPLGLMPEGLRVELDRSVRYRIPDDQEDTLGAETISRPPVFTEFVNAVLGHVEAKLGSEARKLVAQEVSKIQGASSAAFLQELSNGGVPITVTVPHRYVMPLPGGNGLRTLPATRTVRIVLKARLTGQEFMGVVPQRHYLGLRTAVERFAEMFRRRVSRWSGDLVRDWFIFNLPGGNQLWNNSVWSVYGQTARKAGFSDWREDSTGTVADTARSGPGQPDGPAQFLRTVLPSADILVTTAPPAVPDAATLGAAQTTMQTLTVPESPGTSTTVITRHDIYTLDREGVPAIPAPALPAPPGGQPQRSPSRRTTTRLPTWQPQLPAVTLQPLGRNDDFAGLRQGIRVPPELLAQAQARRPGRLDRLSGKLTRLLLPMAAAYTTPQAGASRDDYLSALGANAKAVWANYVSSPPPGASLHKPRSIPLDHAGLLAGHTYLTGMLTKLLSGAASVEIVQPGLLWSTATLEHLADVEYVHVTGRKTPNQMLKQFSANADAASHQVEALSGTMWQHWIEPAGQLPHTAHDFNNDLGPLIDVDHITWNSFIAASRDRYAHDVGLKRTHLGMVQVFLGIRHVYGLNPYQPAKSLLELSRYWPGPRQYFRDDEIRWAEIWVPATDEHLWRKLSRGSGAGLEPGAELEPGSPPHPGPSPTRPATSSVPADSVPAEEPELPGTVGPDTQEAASQTGPDGGQPVVAHLGHDAGPTLTLALPNPPSRSRDGEREVVEADEGGVARSAADELKVNGALTGD